MADLVIRIKANGDEAKKALNDVGVKFDEVGKQGVKAAKISDIAFGSFIGNLASDATKKAFDFVLDFFKGSISESADAGKSLNEFNTSLALSGKYSKETSEDFQAFAAGLQATTTFGDDAIIKNAALIESLGKLSEDGLKEATVAAVNLSSVMGGDLAAASQLIAKASTGGLEALGRYGLRFKTTGNDALDFKNALLEINKQLGGSAQSQVNTYTGSIAQLSEVYGNTKESLGDLITQNPIVLSGIQALKDVFLALQGSIEGNKKSLQELTGDGFEFLISLIPTTAVAISALNLAWENMKSSLVSVANAILQVGKSLFDIKAATLEAAKSIREFVGINSDSISKSIEYSKKQSDLIQKAKDINKSASQERLTDAQKFNANAEIFAKKAQDAIEKRFNETKKLNNEEKDNFLKNLNAKNEGVKAFTKSQLEADKRTFDRKVELAKKQFQYDEEYNHNLVETYKKLDKVIGTEFSNPFADNKKDVKPLNKAQSDELKTTSAVGKGLGVVGAALGGAEGAKSLLVGGASAVADAILPGLGAAVGPLISALSGGPEATREMIKSFAAAAPDLIEAIIESVPVVIEELANQSPKIINKLVEKAPDIIKSLINSVPDIVTSFIEQFTLGAPQIIGSIVNGLYEGVKEIFNSINPFSSDGGSFFSGVGDFVGGLFAEGGQGMIKSVPKGFPNDSFPAMLTEDELVIDRSTTKDLKNFLSGKDVQASLLSKILDAVSQPTNVSSELQFNGKAFADILVQLNRTGARTT